MDQKRSNEISSDQKGGELDLYKSVLRQAPALITIQRGDDLVFEFVNPVAQQIIGDRKVLGLSFRQAFPEPEMEPTIRELEEISRTGKAKNFVELPVTWNFNGQKITRYFNTVMDPLISPEGKVTGVMTFGIDVTEQRAARDAAAIITRKESDERFRILVENITDYAIYLIDPNGNVATWNEGARRLKGYEAHEIIGKNFSKFFVPDEKSWKPKKELEVARTTGRYEEEGWRVKKNGTKFWANIILTPVKNDAGELTGFTKVTRDLTERKRAEDELRRAHERVEKQARIFDTALSSSRDFHYIIDTNHRFTFINKALLRLLGFTFEQAVGKTFQELGFPLDLVKLHESQLNEVLRTRQPVQGSNSFTNFEGKTGYYEYIFVPILDEAGNVIQISGTTRDVTERALSEERIKQSENFLDSVIENIPHMVFVKDAKELRFVRFNKAGEDLLGIPRSEMIGKNDFDFFPEEQAKHFVAKDRDVLSGRTVLQIDEEPIETRRYGRRYLRTRKMPLFGKDGSPEYLLGISEDITEWKKTEAERLKVIREQAALEERRRENERTAFLANASTILAGSLDYRKTLKDLADLAVPAISDWCTVTIVREDMTKERVAAVHADPRKSSLIDELSKYYPANAGENEGVGRVIKIGRSMFGPVVTDAQLERAAADKRHLEIMRSLGVRSCIVVPITTRGKTLGAISLSSNREDHLYSESDLAVAEELGRRAGIAIDNAYLYEAAQKAVQARDEFLSIASHELKTPLTSLKLQVQIRDRDIKRGELKRFSTEKLPKLIQDDERQVNRLIRLVDDMLDISRIQTGKLSLTTEEFDLCELVKDTLSRFAPQIEASGSSVSVSANCVANGKWDRFRIEQVFINLLTNAMKYGAGKPISVKVISDGSQALVSVSDHGIGIERKDQERIFGQFERAVGSGISGLGLGLYISKKIIEAHGGEITVDSEPGRGSTFTMHLPLSAYSVKIKDQPQPSARH